MYLICHLALVSVDFEVFSNDQEFVSAIEGVNGLPWKETQQRSVRKHFCCTLISGWSLVPRFGVQFHPEKNAFEHGEELSSENLTEIYGSQVWASQALQYI